MVRIYGCAVRVSRTSCQSNALGCIAVSLCKESIIGHAFSLPSIFRYCGERTLLKALIYVNIVSPFLLSLLWIRPLARHYFTVRMFPGMEKPL